MEQRYQCDNSAKQRAVTVCSLSLCVEVSGAEEEEEHRHISHITPPHTAAGFCTFLRLEASMRNILTAASCLLLCFLHKNQEKSSCEGRRS